MINYHLEQYLRTFGNDLGFSILPQDKIYSVTASAGQTQITLPIAANADFPILVYVNKILLPKPEGWGILGNIITFSAALALNDNVLIFYHL